MSRSGYSDDCENVGLWRGAVEKAISGKRGQHLLRALRDSLDAMPEKKLIRDDLVREDGQCCALGALAKDRGIDVSKVDPEDRDGVGKLFDIAPALAAEIVYENDEGTYRKETPEERWVRMRAWVDSQIKKPELTTPEVA